MKRIARTTAVNKIKANGGKFFTVTWVTNGGKERTINGSAKKDCITPLGYISVKTKEGYRKVNPQNMTEIRIAGETFKIRK